MALRATLHSSKPRVQRGGAAAPPTLPTRSPPPLAAATAPPPAPPPAPAYIKEAGVMFLSSKRSDNGCRFCCCQSPRRPRPPPPPLLAFSSFAPRTRCVNPRHAPNPGHRLSQAHRQTRTCTGVPGTAGGGEPARRRRPAGLAPNCNGSGVGWRQGSGRGRCLALARYWCSRRHDGNIAP